MTIFYSIPLKGQHHSLSNSCCTIRHVGVTFLTLLVKVHSLLHWSVTIVSKSQLKACTRFGGASGLDVSSYGTLSKHYELVVKG